MCFPLKFPQSCSRKALGRNAAQTLKQAQQVSILKKKCHANVALQESSRDQNADEEPILCP
ncbi:hypothetical protein [Bradyrhizobium sp. WSM2254]|uniref:hypothetical protein n=1 Tax=Bradyrhizobium sp. WSM2254 TaxID=1188263 RepID=UPI000488C626|nr:hypothetical protein [Bradyrhizobium sp. WSM2254]